MDNNYIFKSSRLGFRSWADTDIVALAELTADKEVMKYFPKGRNFKSCRIS